MGNDEKGGHVIKRNTYISESVSSCISDDDIEKALGCHFDGCNGDGTLFPTAPGVAAVSWHETAKGCWFVIFGSPCNTDLIAMLAEEL